MGLKISPDNQRIIRVIYNIPNAKSRSDSVLKAPNSNAIQKVLYTQRITDHVTRNTEVFVVTDSTSRSNDLQ